MFLEKNIYFYASIDRNNKIRKKQTQKRVDVLKNDPGKSICKHTTHKCKN